MNATGHGKFICVAILRLTYMGQDFSDGLPFAYWQLSLTAPYFRQRYMVEVVWDQRQTPTFSVDLELALHTVHRSIVGVF